MKCQKSEVLINNVNDMMSVDDHDDVSLCRWEIVLICVKNSSTMACSYMCEIFCGATQNYQFHACFISMV